MSEDFHEGMDEPEPTPEPRPYITTKAFTCTVNGVQVPFRRGQVIRDGGILTALLAGSAPIVEIVSMSDLGTCPHCGLSFSLSAQADAQDLLRRAQQLMPGYV